MDSPHLTYILSGIGVVLLGVLIMYLFHRILSAKAQGEVVGWERDTDDGCLKREVRFYAQHGSEIRFKTKRIYGEKQKWFRKVPVRYCPSLPRLCCVDCWRNRFMVPGTVILLGALFTFLAIKEWLAGA